MIVRKITIRNFGGIDFASHDFVFGNNDVDREVAYAIAILTNNNFALHHLNEVPVRRDTYLYCEFESDMGEKYTAEMKNGGAVVYTRKGIALSEDEVDSDPQITRPYREDNLVVFKNGSSDEFFDYEKYIPLYMSKLLPYSNGGDEYFYTRSVTYSYRDNLFVKFLANEGLVPMRRIRTSSDKFVRAYRRDCNDLLLRYVCFLYMTSFVIWSRISRKEVQVYTPLLVDGVLDKLSDDDITKSHLLTLTRNTGRQAFFF